MDIDTLLVISGLLTAFIGFTLPVLTLVIFLKEPPQTTDIIDRVLLGATLGLLGLLLIVSGGAVLNGVANGLDIEYYRNLIILDVVLRCAIFIAAWAKIIRTLMHLPNKLHGGGRGGDKHGKGEK